MHTKVSRCEKYAQLCVFWKKTVKWQWQGCLGIWQPDLLETGVQIERLRMIMQQRNYQKATESSA